MGTSLKQMTRLKIEEGIAAVKKALAEDNLDDIKKTMEALTESVYAATTKIYQKIQAEQASQQQAGAGAPPQADKKTDDNVVNADYNVKDE